MAHIRWTKHKGSRQRCCVGSWTERSGLAGPRRVLTERAVGWAVGRLASVEGSVASLARQLGVAWHTMWSHLTASAEQAAAGAHRVGPVAKLGFDETVMASASRRRRRFITAAVDADIGRVVDVFEGRDAVDLRRWVSKQPAWWAGAVEVVCIDPHEGYRSAISTSAHRDFKLGGTSFWRRVNPKEGMLDSRARSLLRQFR